MVGDPVASACPGVVDTGAAMLMLSEDVVTGSGSRHRGRSS